MTREEKKAKDRWEYVSDRLCNSDYPIYNEEHELESAFDAGVEWCEAHPNWISVEDALPEVYEPVLAAAGNHFAVVAIRDNFDWYDSKFGGEKISGITHWQRLPAPPMKGD